MIVQTTPETAEAILGAMRVVATDRGKHPLSDIDRATIVAAARHLATDDSISDIDGLPEVLPKALADTLDDDTIRQFAIGLQAILTLTEAETDKARLGLVEMYAGDLGIDSAQIRDLHMAATGQSRLVALDLARRNFANIKNASLKAAIKKHFPVGTGDTKRAARFEHFRNYTRGSFARALADYYDANAIALPIAADPEQADYFLRHDCAHVLGGYDATGSGEMLTRSFTAGMHREGRLTQLLVTLLMFQLGIDVEAHFDTSTAEYDPETFFAAFERGAQASTDIFDPEWDFWAVEGEQLDELRESYNIR